MRPESSQGGHFPTISRTSPSNDLNRLNTAGVRTGVKFLATQNDSAKAGHKSTSADKFGYVPNLRGFSTEWNANREHLTEIREMA